MNKTKIPHINQHTARFTSIFSQAVDFATISKNRKIFARRAANLQAHRLKTAPSVGVFRSSYARPRLVHIQAMPLPTRF